MASHAVDHIRCYRAKALIDGSRQLRGITFGDLGRRAPPSQSAGQTMPGRAGWTECHRVGSWSEPRPSPAEYLRDHWKATNCPTCVRKTTLRLAIMPRRLSAGCAATRSWSQPSGNKQGRFAINTMPHDAQKYGREVHGTWRSARCAPAPDGGGRTLPGL